MKKNKATCDANSCFMCQNCIEEWRPAICANKTNYKLRKGELIFKEGDPVTGIYFVYSGNVKVYKKWDADKELILRFAKDGAILGHRGIGDDLIYPISASALEDSVVCYIDMKFFESTLKVNNQLTFQLVNFFANELRVSERRMRNLAHMPVKGRVADALLKLQAQFGKTDSGLININLSRQDLASYAGATYETVFRVINELVNENCISLTGKSIAIVNTDALTELTKSA
ncbi:Crp/Fnr family transcriptional regulator [Mucilaginibacter aquatilis]|uniref:Helix-turn-helix domain-containing protein n=1 Tax=Mucilaginibacter aquatilis TaxID=1517760 RepID=A0A6I4I6R1_9SPHI|nr:Crp/Fnr family transcriptional regulator [Mucilaginibacter aquatilis]MVN90850.1 helix-turn-helix domain-containing protein [Mucilaginibacter aquatilis]